MLLLLQGLLQHDTDNQQQPLLTLRCPNEAQPNVVEREMTTDENTHADTNGPQTQTQTQKHGNTHTHTHKDAY